jgi:hypothetical protein
MAFKSAPFSLSRTAFSPGRRASASRPTTGRDFRARARAWLCWARRGRNAWRGHREVSGWSTSPLKPGPLGQPTLSLAPLEFLDRLAALVPPPRRHRHRYHGMLAPHVPSVPQQPPAQGSRWRPVPERRLIALSKPPPRTTFRPPNHRPVRTMIHRLLTPRIESPILRGVSNQTLKKLSRSRRRPTRSGWRCWRAVDCYAAASFRPNTSVTCACWPISTMVSLPVRRVPEIPFCFGLISVASRHEHT